MPELVLLDEPFNALDASLREAVRSDVRSALRAVGATAVLVTHDQEEAMSMADSVALIRDGRVIQSGSPRQIYAAPVDAAVARFVGEAVLLPARVVDGQAISAIGPLKIRRCRGVRGQRGNGRDPTRTGVVGCSGVRGASDGARRDLLRP